MKFARSLMVATVAFIVLEQQIQVSESTKIVVVQQQEQQQADQQHAATRRQQINETIQHVRSQRAKSMMATTSDQHQVSSSSPIAEQQQRLRGQLARLVLNHDQEAEVSSGSKVVLSMLLATVLLILGATLFDFLAQCDARKRAKGYDDIHSQSSDANTESMLIHETDSMGDSEYRSHQDDHDGHSTSARNSTRRLVKQIFLSFSFYHSFALIFQTNNKNNNNNNNNSDKQQQQQQQHSTSAGQRQQVTEQQRQLSIDSLHGLRFLSMIWIIIIHTYSFAFQWSFFKYTSENIYKTAASQLIANGAFACDSFFLIGGFLLPYLTFPAYSSSSSGGSSGGGNNRASSIQHAKTTAQVALHTTGKQQIQLQLQQHQQQQQQAEKKRGQHKFKFTFTRLLANLLHRYLRMMPLMMAIIGLSATLLRYLGEGPAWDYSTQMYDKWCRKNWWINALFLHNFLNTENMCLSHSWYAAVDIQLFLLGQIILFILARSKWLGILICCLSLFGGQLITALITLLYHLPALPLHASVSQQSMSLYYGEIYIKPYCRASPYLIGILLAYLMRTTSLGQVKLKRWQVATGWTVSICSLVLILLSTLPAMNGQPPGELESALYNALSRPLWACATAWMVFACITNHGGPFERLLSARLFIPFSRLSYSAFLVHPIVMAISYGGRQASVPFSHYLMLCLVLGNIVITYASAFLLSSLFELPLLSVERAVKRGWRNSSGDKQQQDNTR